MLRGQLKLAFSGGKLPPPSRGLNQYHVLWAWLFIKSVGHTLCAEIQKIILGRSYRLYDDEERQIFHDDGGHDRAGCPGVCGKAARIAAEIILREQEKGA